MSSSADINECVFLYEQLYFDAESHHLLRGLFLEPRLGF